MKQMRKFIGMLLTLCFVLGMMPAEVLAASPTALFVNGIDILQTADNKVACGDGTAEYNAGENMLTLTNVTIDGNFSGQAAISANGDLTIQLVGDNTITSGYYGVYTNNGRITVGGSGTLTINASNDCMRATDLVIGIAGEPGENAPTVNATGLSGYYASGLYATNTLTIQNGAKVNAKSEAEGYALCGDNGIVITGSEVSADTVHAMTNTIFTAGALEITDSTVTASADGWCALQALGTISITRSTVSASAEADIAIYSDGGAVHMIDSAVTAESPSNMYSIYGATGGSLSGTWLDSTGFEVQSAITANAQNSVIIQNSTGTVAGNAVLRQDEELRAGVVLTIPEGTSLTVEEGATLQNNGTVILNGSFINNNGTVICADSSHVGGTATCTDGAVCELCGQAYGAVNPDNHTGKTVWTQTETTHSSSYDCCGTIAAAEEAHEWENGVCRECGYECQHTFAWVTDKEATETAAGLKHEQCTICGYAKTAVEIPAAGTPTDTDTPGDGGQAGDTPGGGEQAGDTTAPKTGDDSNAAFWVAVMLAAGTAMVGTALYNRKRKYSR